MWTGGLRRDAHWFSQVSDLCRQALLGIALVGSGLEQSPQCGVDLLDGIVDRAHGLHHMAECLAEVDFDNRVQLPVDRIRKFVELTDGRRDSIHRTGPDRSRSHGQ